MDLQTGFDQIRVKPDDVEKRAFITKYGQFEYLVLPMGLCNAPATFQSLMKDIFHDCLGDSLVLYMDELLIFSKDLKSNIRHVETVVTKLGEHYLYDAPKKWELMRDDIEFLGLLVGMNGIKEVPRKVDVLRTWPKTVSITDIRSFLGLMYKECSNCGHYRPGGFQASTALQHVLWHVYATDSMLLDTTTHNINYIAVQGNRGTSGLQ